MARLPYPKDIANEAQSQIQRLPLNLSRMMAHAPEIIPPYMDLVFSFKKGKLDPKIRELVILRVASLCGCPYEQLHHRPGAKLAGASDAEIAAAEGGEPGSLAPELALAMQFANECTKDVRVSDATFAAAQLFWSPQQITELTVLIGFYLLTARILRTLDIDEDAQPVDWSKTDKAAR